MEVVAAAAGTLGHGRERGGLALVGLEAVKPKDEWLVTQLFEQIEMLLSKVEAGERLTTEERLGMSTLQAQRKELGLGPETELKKPLPWMYRMRHVLFGWWEDVEDESVRYGPVLPGGVRVGLSLHTILQAQPERQRATT
ncbi:MAG: hypothetical protein U9Q78_00620 [Chloroflexota bacterium]|nr:hypothetical protein [Chloroflexota bacterium]